MRILFLNNSGAGFADHIDVPEGMTIDQLLAERLPHIQADDLLIRVNRQPVARGYVLQANDRVTCTPTKIQGAL